jgi:hypothetical protein
MARQGSGAARQALTEQDVAAVREEVSAGRAVTVWFTAAAVGVPEGGSAKVLGVGEVAEGDFIQVRPAGSRDAVFCSPGELTRSRPARKAAASRQPAKAAARATAPAEPAASPPPAERAEPAPPAASRKPAAQAEPARPAAPARAAGPATPVEQAPTNPRPAKASPSRTRKRAPGDLTVTLTSTAEGDWKVEVLVGAKRVVPSTPVQAAEVAAVSRALPPAVTEVMTSALAEARQRQEERVAHLREELDAAQRALEQLGVD